MSGVPLLNSHQSDFSLDANQNHQIGPTTSEGSPNSSNELNIHHVVDTGSAPVTMGNNNNRISISSQNNAAMVTEIKLHGYDSYMATAEDMNLPVQELIKKIFNSPGSQFKEIGPSALQLFGIASLDQKRKCKCIWKNPKVSLASSKSSLDTSSSSLYLRIRFIPSKTRVDKLKILGKEIIHYLFHQCKDDFIKDRFTYLHGKEISAAKARGLAVVDVAITSRIQNKPADKVLKNDLKNFLPRRERVKYWKQYKLKENMKPHLLKFENQPLELEEMMVGYITDVLQEVMEYTIEEYDAYYKTMEMRDKKKVKILVDIHHEPSGIRIDQDHFAKVEDIKSINMRPNYHEKDHSWIVHMDRSSGCSKEITFENEDIATSFVSGIDGYYRLINDYYFSPCHEVEPPSLEELKSLKCFGPIEDGLAIQKLRRQDLSTEDFYILTQSFQNFDQYVLHFTHNRQVHKRILMLKPGKRFCIKDNEEQVFEDIQSLMRFLSSENPLLPTKIPRRIGRPNIGEACGMLKQLFMDEKEILDEEAEKETSANSLKKMPRIFLPSEFHINELLNVGDFTEVHNAVLNDDTAVAVKVLRQVKREQMYRCFEPFQNSITKHISFMGPHFLNIQGICLSTPPKVIMDYSPLGSLSTFFVRRRPDQPLYLHHLMFAATQVAEGLLYLAEHDRIEFNEIFHGNICCKNILVLRYEFNSIMVKIGDPGMISLYNQLPVTDAINKKRLPWIAPERFQDLSAMSLKTDIYAFGTTMWEMFAQGSNPLDYPPLLGKSTEEVQRFFMSDNVLPRPPGLVEKSCDAETIQNCKSHLHKVMLACWKLDVTDRITPKEVVRDLNSLSCNYGASYHLYDEIPDDLISMSASNNTSDQDSNEVPDILTNLMEREASESCDFPQSLPKRLPEPPRSVNTPVNTGLKRQNSLPNSEKPLIFSKNPAVNQNLDLKKLNLPQAPSIPVPSTPLLNLKYLIDTRKVVYDKNTNIGKGHYGEVKQGRLLFDLQDRSKYTNIAIKTLSGDYQSVLDDPEFKNEAELMCGLNHKNVVKFIGICDNKIIMEYVVNNAMSVYLREKRKTNDLLPISKILFIVEGVAQGMDYIYLSSNKRIIHCDLAGRNILLDKDCVAKISDFGLAKALAQDKDYYTRSTKKELPAKWCAPEALGHRRFTTKSDVWSYGIVVWEGVTHGKSPYSDWGERIDFGRFKKGDRLSQPENCPDDVYDLMKQCWQYKADQRPGFDEIKIICGSLLRKYSGGGDQLPFEDGAASSAAATVNKTQTTPSAQQAQGHSHRDSQPPNTTSQSLNVVPSSSSVTLVVGHVSAVNSHSPFSVQTLSSVVNTPVSSHLSTNQGQLVGKIPTPTVSHHSNSTALPSNSTALPSNSKLLPSNSTALPSNSKLLPSNSTALPSNTLVTSPSASPGGIISKPVTSPVTTPSGEMSPPIFSPIGSPSTTSPLSLSFEMKGRQLPLPPHEDIKFLINIKELKTEKQKVLGIGNYGTVFEGTYKGRKVAIKILKSEFQDKLCHRDEFIEEIDIIGKLKHQNIVQFVGFSLNDCTMVMEFLEKGSLLKYLTDHKENKLSCQQILKICQDIAEGMAYLASEKIIHCDLAARNVLLSDDCQAKISDFGLSKILNENKDYYKRSGGKNVPAYWCAPEVLTQHKLTTKGDIWSYGVVVWEAFTHGDNPNICKTLEELREIGIHLLEKGVRLCKPDNCPRDVYELMMKCWFWNPNERPPFTDIVAACKMFLEQLEQQGTLD